MDANEKIDSLVKEDIELGKQMERITARINASVAMLKTGDGGGHMVIRGGD